MPCWLGLLLCAAAASPPGGERGPAFLERALPGAPPPDAALAERLRTRWRERRPGYEARTRHREPDGSPHYTNRLFLESSPYLLQHAHNPVNWYAWGDEAFAAARRLGRPVFLSVGYSTCHWCHVMEEESFEDEAIARYLNEHYVAIKVDREERPDVDAIYMSAVQALSGHGGWPMSVWLTPEREPFYGGTYFPARDGDRGAQVGFLSLLERVALVYRERPDEVADSASHLARTIRSMLAAPDTHGGLPGPETVRAAAEQFLAAFDPRHGGTRGAPKFPSTLPVRLLLRHHRRSADTRARDAATRSLEAMAAGGIYDQVGGGFHRYSTDERWLVPHFEKMLYDNALLVPAYLEAWQVTGRDEFARVARDVLRYVARDMTSPEGAFYSATDADSLGADGRREEGLFFTWTPAEIEAVVGPARARVVRSYYAVTPQGNFEGRSVLHVPRPDTEVARELGLTADALRAEIAEAKRALHRARAGRPAPLRDEKVLAAWNGLMISAYAQAALILGDDDHAATAERAARFVLQRMRRDGRLRRSWLDGRAQHEAYLEDYAFLIAGLVDLFEATGRPEWLDEALLLDRVLAEHFEDAQNGGWYRTADDHEALLAREKPFYDGAEPSGNSVQVLNLLRLYELTTDESYRRRADRALRAAGGLVERAPAAAAEMLRAVDFRSDTPKEVIIVTGGSRAAAGPLLDVLRRTFLPNRVVAVVPAAETGSPLVARIPLLAGKLAREGQATAYVCVRGACALPTSDPEVFARQLTTAPPVETPAARPGQRGGS